LEEEPGVSWEGKIPRSRASKRKGYRTKKRKGRCRLTGKTTIVVQGKKKGKSRVGKKGNKRKPDEKKGRKGPGHVRWGIGGTL